MRPRALALGVGAAMFALALAGTGCVYEATARCNPGEMANDCVSCLARPGCGFCRLADSTTACLEGGALGPTSDGPSPFNACRAGVWSFRSCGESAPPPPRYPCDDAQSCDQCVGREGCGWCGASGACVRGSFQGPFGSTCARGWAHEHEMCPDGG